MKATNLKEAEHFFLSHSSGTLTCVKDGFAQEVDCYPDALEFFMKNETKPKKKQIRLNFMGATALATVGNEITTFLMPIQFGGNQYINLKFKEDIEQDSTAERKQFSFVGIEQ